MAVKNKIIPEHIVIIPDGNRRWAKKRNLPTIEGHKKGFDIAMQMAKSSRNLGVKVLTMWGFSTENWRRSNLEVKYLMKLYNVFFKKHLRELESEGVKFNWIGRRDRVPSSLRETLEKVEKATAKNTKYVLNICIDYGGRDEIVRAIKRIVSKKVKPSKIDEALISANMDTGNLPDPDLLIRTSGEARTSGMMPWQTVYTELFFSKKYFPDFSVAELKRAISEFGIRQRRYGQ